MDPSLIERITELVMAELTRPGPVPAAGTKSGNSRRILVAAISGPDGPGWQALRGLSSVSWLGVGCPDQLRARLGEVRSLPAPGLWDDTVAGAEAVVLPYLPLAALSRIALLLADSPPVAAALAGVVQGVPVLACSDDVERVRRHSNRLPAGFLTLFQQHVRSLEAMGIELLEPAALVSRLSGETRPPTQASSRGRDVVTLEDVQAAGRAGQSLLELAQGSIVTPLAQEAAKQMGIEVRFR